MLTRYRISLTYASKDNITLNYLTDCEAVKEGVYLATDNGIVVNAVLTDLIVHCETAWFHKALMNKFYSSNDRLVKLSVEECHLEALEFLGLARDEASGLAAERNLSFRVVEEDGVAHLLESGFNEKRVNVSLVGDTVVAAEYY